MTRQLMDFIRGSGLAVSDLELLHAEGGQVQATFCCNGKSVEMYVRPPSVDQNDRFKGELIPHGFASVRIDGNPPICGPIDPATFRRIKEAIDEPRAEVVMAPAPLAAPVAPEPAAIDPFAGLEDMSDELNVLFAIDPLVTTRLVDKVRAKLGAALPADSPAPPANVPAPAIQASPDAVSEPEPEPPPVWSEDGRRVWPDGARPRSPFGHYRPELPRGSGWANS
jgi:hypothetical protein